MGIPGESTTYEFRTHAQPNDVVKGSRYLSEDKINPIGSILRWTDNILKYFISYFIFEVSKKVKVKVVDNCNSSLWTKVLT